MNSARANAEEELFSVSLIYSKEILMKKTYNIEVDCAACAAKMEAAAKKTPGVADAAVNFMALKMTVEFTPDADPAKVMKAVLTSCRKIEDECEIYF